MKAPRCLGKLPAVHDPRTLRLAKLLVPSLPAAPPSRDWSVALPVDLGMMSNDVCGDCTCAGAAHLVQTWTANNGGELTLGDADVVAAYSDITGYTPSDPTTDRGAVLLDVLNAWRQNGIGGHKIGGYVAVNHLDLEEVAQAIDLFGGVYTGAMLPVCAQAQVGATWSDTSGAAGGWGGHCLAAVAYNDAGLTYVTWGKRQLATWQWFAAYADECYAIISVDWVTGAKPAPSGFDLPTLQAYLAQIR